MLRKEGFNLAGISRRRRAGSRARAICIALTGEPEAAPRLQRRNDDRKRCADDPLFASAKNDDAGGRRTQRKADLPYGRNSRCDDILLVEKQLRANRDDPRLRSSP
jgi:hypothetical protein